MTNVWNRLHLVHLFYALVTYDRSGILKTMGKDDESLYYLILSAISDVRSAIKEQSSIMNLAQIMYERGDITRANTYINFSWSVTEAYKTRMRTGGISYPIL